MALIAALWLWLRQDETLPQRKAVAALAGTRCSARPVEVFRNPVTMGYTMAVGFIFGRLHLLSRNLPADLCRAV